LRSISVWTLEPSGVDGNSHISTYRRYYDVVQLTPKMDKIMTAGSGIFMDGVLWLIFWIGPALPLFEADPRWGHNFAFPILFITVGLAYHFRKISCQLVAVFASFLTIPTSLAMWSWAEATFASIALLIVTIILYLVERNRDVELINPKPRLNAWVKIHFLNFAYIGLAHMPLIFFLVRWLNPQPFLNYLPVEHELTTSAFNLMLLVFVPLAAMERYVKKLGGLDVSKLCFAWAILMIIIPLIIIGLP